MHQELRVRNATKVPVWPHYQHTFFDILTQGDVLHLTDQPQNPSIRDTVNHIICLLTAFVGWLVYHN